MSHLTIDYCQNIGNYMAQISVMFIYMKIYIYEYFIAKIKRENLQQH